MQYTRFFLLMKTGNGASYYGSYCAITIIIMTIQPKG